MSETVLYALNDGVAEITLNRPARRNAIDAGMRTRLAEVVTAVRDDASVRCVILRGAGGFFCSGGRTPNRWAPRATRQPTHWRAGVGTWC